MIKCYKIVKDNDVPSPYAVFVKCTGFWQQISPWYFRRGNAERYLWKITKSYSKGCWSYAQISGKDRLISAEVEID